MDQIRELSDGKDLHFLNAADVARRGGSGIQIFHTNSISDYLLVTAVEFEHQVHEKGGRIVVIPQGSRLSMPSTHKKVVVRKMDRDSVNGFVAAGAFLNDGRLEMLNTAGNVVTIELRDIKGVYFVREFGDSETLVRKTFTSRPRTEGLWVRVRFRDNETLEGLMPNDLTQITAEGFFVNPPDTRANTQRIFIPRTALAELTVLAVIGSRTKRPPAEHDLRQVPMFEK